jgi:hypothetical protein
MWLSVISWIVGGFFIACAFVALIALFVGKKKRAKK